MMPVICIRTRPESGVYLDRVYYIINITHNNYVVVDNEMGRFECPKDWFIPFCQYDFIAFHAACKGVTH